MSTITIPKILANFETSLAATMSAVATSLTLNTSVDGDGTTLSGLYSLTLDEGTSSEEHMLVTMTGASGAVSRRGLSRVDAYTEVTANKHVHNRGASVKVTNVSAVNIQRLLNGDDTFNSVNWLGVNSITGLATPTSGETTKAANIAYVNAVAIAGGVDATTSVKGLVKMSTAPVSATSPIAVGDNDTRVPTIGQTALLAAITADAAEINKLDGLTTTAAELTKLADTSANVTSTSLNALTAGATSNADTYHIHASLYGRSVNFVSEISTDTLSYGMVGFSDATTKLITLGFSTNTNAIKYSVLGFATDFGSSFYTKLVPTSVANSRHGVVRIGTDTWTSDNGVAAGSRIIKNGTAVTISGTTPGANVSQLAHDSTNSYLLALDSTTTILRYSGIAGTTITFVSTITLDTAVTTYVGFLYDDTNSRYICLDITGNLIRRFNSSGTTVDTVAYTFDDGVTSGLTNNNVVGLVFIDERVHIVTMTVTDIGSQGFVDVKFIPTSMTR